MPPNGTVTANSHPLSQLSPVNLHQIFGGADLRRVAMGGQIRKKRDEFVALGPKKRCFLSVVNLIHDFWVYFFSRVLFSKPLEVN